MEEQQAYRAIPKPTLERLPRYLNYLRAKSAEGMKQISSATIAKDLKLTSIQVRKDLAYVSSGKPRVGHNTRELILRLEQFLNCGDSMDAVLVGVGHLGQALLAYQGFSRYGIRIVAAFDSDSRMIGQEIHGRSVASVDMLNHLAGRLSVSVGVITVPASQAQAVCDMLVACGVRGIFNFSPAHLNVPDGVTVRNEDIAASLALLFGAVRETDQQT